jgi:TatD DNase family protein
MPALVDSHCHLDAAEFDGDRAAVVARARAAGVGRQLVPAVATSRFEVLRALCAADEGLFPAYGLHPMFMAEHRAGDLETLARWLDREQPVALGECGLDFFIDDPDREAQRRLFHAQVELARDRRLPLILHARRALDEVIAALRHAGARGGVVHSFSGSPEQARQLWALDFRIGIGGPVTHDRARRLRHIVATMPIEFLLLETDAPDQPPAGHRGERNEPARLAEILSVVAGLRGEDPARVAEATSRNAERVFGLAQYRRA